MQKVKRTLSFILSLVILLCAACVPVNAVAKKAEPTGIYGYIMKNGYPTMSTEDFFKYVNSIDNAVYLLTGFHFVAQDKFNVVLDDKLDALCSSVARASGLDAALIMKSMPEFNGLAVKVSEKYHINVPELQKKLNELSEKYAKEGNSALSLIFRAAAVYFGIIDEAYLYCVPVKDLEDTYEIYCRVTYRDGRTEELPSGTYYNIKTQMLYGKDDNGMVGIGYDFDVGKAMVITPVHVWMRNFGFTVAYDIFCYITPLFNYQTARIKFNYAGSEWMIQLWKGRYVITNGAEIGIYKREPGSKGTFYNCVGDEDMLLMSLDLFHGDDLLVHRDPMYHWWLTGFTVSKTVYLPQSLTLTGSITFKDAEMTCVFCEGIENRNFHDISYQKNGITVTFEW